jgi:hypothetical protein
VSRKPPNTRCMRRGCRRELHRRSNHRSTSLKWVAQWASRRARELHVSAERFASRANGVRRSGIRFKWTTS